MRNGPDSGHKTSGVKRSIANSAWGINWYSTVKYDVQTKMMDSSECKSQIVKIKCGLRK